MGADRVLRPRPTPSIPGIACDKSHQQRSGTDRVLRPRPTASVPEILSDKGRHERRDKAKIVGNKAKQADPPSLLDRPSLPNPLSLVVGPPPLVHPKETPTPGDAPILLVGGQGAAPLDWLGKEQEAYAQAERYLFDAKRRGILSPPRVAQNASSAADGVDSFSNLEDVRDEDVDLDIDIEKTSSRWERMTREKQLREIVWGTEKHARKNVAKAQLPENTHMFDFSLEQAVHGKRGNPDRVPQPEGPWTLFAADCPERAVSNDQYDLVYRFPQAFRGKTLKDLEKAMLDWGAMAPRQTNGKNDFGNSYKQEYAISGRTRIALLWHAIGRRNSAPVVCADIRKTGESFEAAMDLLERLEIVNAYCMRTLLCIDPLQYGLLHKVYSYRLSNYASQRAFAALDKKMLWEGREIIFNRWSPLHWDKQDPPMSWACIAYVGDFDGAYFEFPQLRLKLLLRPGDVVFFRGHDLLHSVPEWLSGQRHFLVHFTHRALWQEAGIPCASSRARGV